MTHVRRHNFKSGNAAEAIILPSAEPSAFFEDAGEIFFRCFEFFLHIRRTEHNPGIYARYGYNKSYCA